MHALNSLRCARVVQYLQSAFRRGPVSFCGASLFASVPASQVDPSRRRGGEKSTLPALTGQAIHQRGPGRAAFGDDATVGTGPIAGGSRGVSRWLRCTAAPATVTTATMSRSHQPPRSECTNLDQKPPTARGGVIARVRISTRQKLNRPLRFMQALTSGQPPGSYHSGAAESRLSHTITQLHGGRIRSMANPTPRTADRLERPPLLALPRTRKGRLRRSPGRHHPGPVSLAPSAWPRHPGPVTLARNSPLPPQVCRSQRQPAVPAMASAGGSGRWR
jgi:hypothetical protein